MIIEVTLSCPCCNGTHINKNGTKGYGTQNYLCKDCGRQFVADHDLKYKGCLSWLSGTVKRMMARGSGVRDIAYVLSISIKKVLSVLKKTDYDIKPKLEHYDKLEVDEFWTYIGSKNRKAWLIYAYHRETGEIVSYVWGKRNTGTAKRLLKKIKSSGITYGELCTDNWEAFTNAFVNEPHTIGKIHTQGIEGNNCRLRHRMRRAFRKTCCFSKKPIYHNKAFELVIHYINFGFV